MLVSWVHSQLSNQTYGHLPPTEPLKGASQQGSSRIDQFTSKSISLHHWPLASPISNAFRL